MKKSDKKNMAVLVLTVVPMIVVDISSQGFSRWLAPVLTRDAWIAILYAGVMSCGVAYTLQIVGQKGVEPTVASLLLSLESVFSVLAGRVILKEFLGIKEISGCVLIFTAVILAQLPDRK